MHRLLVLLAGTFVVLPASVNAQEQRQVEIYGRGAFKGPSMSFSEPTQHIDPAFTARSVRIVGNSSWELCSGNTYTGCRRVDKSTPGAVFIVRSARPVAPLIVTRVSPPNQSLRGVESEFFIAPTRGHARVAVPAGHPEEMRRVANDFCRSAGWPISAHAQVQQDGPNYYLVDVLCAKE